MALTKESALRKDTAHRNGNIDGLQHRHFAVIAGVLKELNENANGGVEAMEHVICKFANACAASNPRFDRERFLRACGVMK